MLSGSVPAGSQASLVEEVRHGDHDANRQRDRLLPGLHEQRHHGHLVVAAEPVLRLRLRYRTASQPGLHREHLYHVQVKAFPDTLNR